MKLLLTANTSFKLANFRAGLLRALARDGHELIALVPEDSYTEALRKLSCRIIPLYMDNKGTSPLRDAALTLRFRRIFREERPDAILGFTIKNNIYGALAARSLGTPFIPNVTGLGTAFIHDGLVNRVVKLLYRRAFADLPVVYFQNPDDRALFEQAHLTRPGQARMLPGSGIDLEAFTPSPLPPRDEGLRFVLIARLLRDKGVVEFVDAARQLRAKGVAAQFVLLGPLGAENRTAIPARTITAWEAEGVIAHPGAVQNVRPEIARAHCVVLPSYREGTPRTLLEAGAMGRPIITTDVPGCRETVIDGTSGLLCRVRNAADLADKMRALCEMSPEVLERMGRAGRAHIEAHFDEQHVIAAYRAALAEIGTPSRTV